MRRIFAVALLVPVFAFAQSDAKAQIRAQLLQDPNSAEMSEAELDAMVNALAEEAQSTKDGSVFLEAQNDPSFIYDPAPVAEPASALSLLTAPIILASGLLFLALIGVIYFTLHHRHKIAPDLQNS